MKIGLVLAAILLMMIFGAWLTVYRYHDCRRVGHSTLYCMTDGSN